MFINNIMSRVPAFVIVILVSGCAAVSPERACPIGGEAVQWQADYCLYETGTDDIIAAQPCMDRESRISFRDICAEKKHYKEKLCRRMVASGSRPGSVDDCMKDLKFSGPTVRNGGA